MAQNILTVHYTTGATVTTRFESADGKVWDGAALTAFATATPAEVATAENPAASGRYNVTIPAGLTGSTTTPLHYKAVSYVSGIAVRATSFVWDGSGVVSPVAAAGLLDLAAGVETGLTLREAMRLLVAASAGKLSGAATTTIVIRNIADSKNRITATVDGNGNRTAITTDLT